MLIDSAVYKNVLVIENTILVITKATKELRESIQNVFYMQVYDSAIHSGSSSAEAEFLAKDYVNSESGLQEIANVLNSVDSEKTEIYTSYYANGIGRIKRESADPIEPIEIIKSYSVY